MAHGDPARPKGSSALATSEDNPLNVPPSAMEVDQPDSSSDEARHTRASDRRAPRRAAPAPPHANQAPVPGPIPGAFPRTNSSNGNSTSAATRPPPERRSSQDATNRPGIDNLCVVCRKKPKAVENGRKYETCDLECEEKLHPTMFNNTAAASSSDDHLCNVCHQRARLFDDKKGILYEQCGKRCRDQARGNQMRKAPAPATRATRDPSPTPANTTAPREGPDYSASIFIPASDSSCLMCWMEPRGVDYPGPFCSGKCADSARAGAPLLLEAPRGHVAFAELATRFRDAWEKGDSKIPQVRKVYKVVQPAMYQDQYNRLKSHGGRTEHQLWFGAARTCPVGNGGNTALCGPACQLCAILNTTFSSKAFSTGISLFPCSSQADKKAGSPTGLPLKTLLFVNVATPSNCPTVSPAQRPSKQPDGGDCIAIETTTPTRSDELIVYNGHAVLASYLVMYDSD